MFTPSNDSLVHALQSGEPSGSLDSWANSGFAQQYDTGTWLGRTFDSGKYDMINSAYASAADRQYNYLMQRDAQDYNAKQAELAWQRSEKSAQAQRAFEERMSNTAYERAFVQLRKQGLNPYLAVSGQPASTPAGVAGSANSASVGASHSNSRSSSVSAYGSQALVRAIGNVAAMAANAGISAYSAARLSAVRPKVGF